MVKEKFSKEIKFFFSHYTEHKSCLVTSDGQIFIKDAEYWAKQHASRNGLSIYEVDRSNTEKLVEAADEGSSSPTKKETKTEPQNQPVTMDNTIKQLREFAQSKEIVIPDNITRKADILQFILNELENRQSDHKQGLESSDLKTTSEGKEGSEDDTPEDSEVSDEDETGEFKPTKTQD